MKKGKPETAWIGSTETALGFVWAAVSRKGLAALEIGGSQEKFEGMVQKLGYAPIIVDPKKTAEALKQVSEYLAGRRQNFELMIDWSGLTPFQLKALQATAEIPYGETATYLELALRLGNPRSARAVGRAEATNPIPLVIPCHRVLGTDGGLHGYGGGEGLKTKAWLLEMEKQSG